MHFFKSLLTTAVFAFICVTAVPSALGSSNSINTLELDRRVPDEIDNTAAQVAKIFFGDLLSADDWQTVCDSISQSIRSVKQNGTHHQQYTRDLSLPGIIVSGLSLIYGENLGKFARTLLMDVIAISLLLAEAGIP